MVGFFHPAVEGSLLGTGWTKYTRGFAAKTQVVMVANRLGISRQTAAVMLIEKVYDWLDDVLTDAHFDSDGNASVVVGSDPGAHLDARTDVPGLADAMTAAGWLIIRNSSLVFPQAARHNGPRAKARITDSERKRNVRGDPPNVRETSAKCPPNIPPGDIGGSLPLAVGSISEKENQRQTPKAKTKTPLPPILAKSESFRSAWDEWLAYRTGSRKKMTDKTVELQLDMLERLGPDKAVAAIEASIRNGWTGLFEPKQNGVSQKGSHDAAEARRAAQRAQEYD